MTLVRIAVLVGILGGVLGCSGQLAESAPSPRNNTDPRSDECFESLADGALPMWP